MNKLTAATWDSFVTAHGSHFLQSWDWGELQQRLGKTIHRLTVGDSSLTGAALVIEMPLPFGLRYLYCPRGPLAVNTAAAELIWTKLRELARQRRATFIRVEPPEELAVPADGIRTADRQPMHTMVLDLTKTTEDLLTAMHPKTRYNIGLAERKGVTVRTSTSADDVDACIRLLADTYRRAGIRSHPDNYYRQLLSAQGKMTATLYLAEYAGQAVAANLVYRYGTTTTYAHGGSDHTARAVMAPHLLQWQQIRAAKDAGATTYDFWGYDEKRWPGVSRFKAGFNGTVLAYPGTFDVPVSPARYQVYRLAQLLRGRG